MSITIALKVAPGSGKQKISLDKSGLLKCYLKSQPERGKANNELISFLADVLDLPQNAITITHGLTDRKKILKIETDRSSEEIMRVLRGDQQLSIY